MQLAMESVIRVKREEKCFRPWKRGEIGKGKAEQHREKYTPVSVVNSSNNTNWLISRPGCCQLKKRCSFVLHCSAVQSRTQLHEGRSVLTSKCVFLNFQIKLKRMWKEGCLYCRTLCLLELKTSPAKGRNCSKHEQLSSGVPTTHSWCSWVLQNRIIQLAPGSHSLTDAYAMNY